jgi:hypothetical protein
VDLLARHLDYAGHLDERGNHRPAAMYALQAEAAAAKARDALGLSPIARARLGRDVAATGVDLARLWAGSPDPARGRQGMNGRTEVLRPRARVTSIAFASGLLDRNAP